MYRLSNLSIRAFPLVLAWIVLSTVACGPAEDVVQGEAQAAEWTYLVQAHEELTASRQELRGVQERVRAGVAAIPEEDLAGMSPEEAHQKLGAQASELQQDVYIAAEAFSGRLVDFINSDPMIEGEEPSARQIAAVRMKTGEDIEVALEYIEKGGDYRKAIDIFETALRADPDDERLQAELEKAKAMRYLTEERFDQVKKRMSQEEIRGLLGPVYHRNIREFEDQGVLAWFYRKQGGGTYAVYFRERRGQWQVYETKFIPRQEETGE